MSTIANKLICLNLNANWKPIGYKTVKDAIISLCGAINQSKPSTLAIDIDYDLNDNGDPIWGNPKSMNPVSWDEWIQLPVRSWEMSISSVSRQIRVPTIIIALNYKKMRKKYFDRNPNREDICIRDNFTCQYSGRKLEKSEITLDHITPKSKGGQDSWENLVVCDKDINTKKSNSFNGEVGLKLLKQPVKPEPILISSLIKEAKHPDWELFLNK